MFSAMPRIAAGGEPCQNLGSPPEAVILQNPIADSHPANSELRASVDPDGVACDPARLFGSEECNDRPDIGWFRDTLQGLHAKGECAAILCLREARHICVDDAGRDSVDADAVRAECRGEMLYHCVNCPLGGRIGRQCSDCGMRHKRGDEYNAAAATQDRKQLLDKEEWRADIDREEMVEILDCRVLDRGRL